MILAHGSSGGGVGKSSFGRTRLYEEYPVKNVIVLVVVVVLAPTLLEAEVLLREDFEGDKHQALRITHTDGGDIKVHHRGVSDEKAFGGKRSFKIDLTIPKGSYVYCMIPVEFSYTKTQNLKSEGKIHAEGADVSLGYFTRIPKARLSDLTQRGEKQKDLSLGWSTWEAYDPRFYETAMPLFMHGLGVYITPKSDAKPWRFSDTRVVVYVDDLTVTAIRRHVPRLPAETIEPADGYKIVPVKAITNDKILTSSPRIPESMKLDSLELTAARDEFESASFAILSGKELRHVRITMSPLSKGDDTITSFDLWAVKCWYQPRPDDVLYEIVVPTLTPELLLHDDELVQVDVKSNKQQVRAADSQGNEEYFDIMAANSALKQEFRIEDAPALLPVTIDRLEPKQFWLTVYVPPVAPPGDYSSTIRVEPENAPPKTLPMTLKVLPFRLPPPCLEYSHFYRAQLKEDNIPIISSELKTEQQLAAEFEDMKDHGVTNPNVYQGLENLEKYLTIRNATGMSQDRLFLVHGVDATDEHLDRTMALAQKFGFQDVYLYGHDEATGDGLLHQRPSWERVRRLGFKMFVACYSRDFHGGGNPGFFDLIGDILDAPILAGPARPDLAEKVSRNGFRLYMYANPQYGLAVPETYRRNFGLSLWKGGYSGAMDYAYQHGLDGHMWNDFALGIYDRMTYPTSSGVVDTMAWEGFREGVDDVRYITLLLKLLDEASKVPATRDKGATIRQWLESLDTEGDLDEVRVQLREKIATLRSPSRASRTKPAE
jgi:hypothetical protein